MAVPSANASRGGSAKLQRIVRKALRRQGSYQGVLPGGGMSYGGAQNMRVVILGGGFGGLYVALELEKTLGRDPDVNITVVNRENFFLFTPMLHEVAASDLDLTSIVNPVRKLLRRVNFMEGEVDKIDLEQ